MEDNVIEETEIKEEKKKSKKNKVNEEIILLKEELGLEKEKNLRVQAELVNYKRRRDEEVANMFKYASEDIIISLLPVIDNFERAIKLDDNDLTDEISKFLAGFKMIYGNFIDILNKNEVKEIEADGLEFNPNFHQAVLTEKDENKPAGVVLEILQKGYLYKEKVIRPAMVKVNE
ncbi:MAG: nucleotide exchange factor GrpE [Bacilli bacterium]|nr:nucleotide exchange factor GrpE [Bacilli bacterium]